MPSEDQELAKELAKEQRKTKKQKKIRYEDELPERDYYSGDSPDY